MPAVAKIQRSKDVLYTKLLSHSLIKYPANGHAITNEMSTSRRKYLTINDHI